MFGKTTITEKQVPVVEVKPEFQDWVEPFSELRAELIQVSSESVMPKQREMLKTYIRSLGLIEKAIAAGYEPFSPPATWPCGFVEEIWENYVDGAHYDGTPRRGSRVVDMADWPSSNTRGQIYHGIISPSAQREYPKAAEIFGKQNVVVYANTADDFHTVDADLEPAKVRPRLHVDPFLVGRVRYLPDIGKVFFLIKQWDLGKDLFRIDLSKVVALPAPMNTAPAVAAPSIVHEINQSPELKRLLIEERRA